MGERGMDERTMTPTSEEIEARAKEIAARYQIQKDWGLVDECVRTHYRLMAAKELERRNS